MLNPEITAPLRPFLQDRQTTPLPSFPIRQASHLIWTQQRPQHPQGAWSSTGRPAFLDAFIIYKVPSTALSLLARCLFITLCQLPGSSSLDTQSFVCLSSFKELQFSSPTRRFQRNVACSHLATRDDQLPHQDRRRALCVPFGSTQVEFSFDMQVLLPALLPVDRAPTRAPKFNVTATHKPDDSAPRANQTTAHDETSRARRHEGRTAPCQSAASRLHRLTRTTDF